MSGSIFVRYCSAPIVLLYTRGLARGVPLDVEKCFPTVEGVGAGLSDVRFNFVSKSSIYLDCVSKRLGPSHVV